MDKTVVAIASAPGFGQVGIVRLSGPEAIVIADSLMELVAGRCLAEALGFTRHEGEVHIDGDLTVPAWCYVFFAPRSYTRQDSVEIYAPGSPAVIELIRQQALQHGAIAAEPGEFTARAFLNGAMDLTSAEAVATVIGAQNDVQLRAAHRMQDGALSRRIRACRDNIAELLALVEADIDFAEEPIDFISPAELESRLSALAADVDSLLRNALRLEQLSAEPTIALVGLPNTGKSALMNRLCGTQRAISEAVSGTTRDVLAAKVRLDGISVTLLDTAGVDDESDGVIFLAQKMTTATLRQADMTCLVIDAAEPNWPRVAALLDVLDRAPAIIVLNKSDRLAAQQVDAVIDRTGSMSGARTVVTSAKTGDGLAELRLQLSHVAAQLCGTVGGEAMVFNQRQHAAVREAHEAFVRARELCRTATETIDCADLLAFEFREALDALGSVTGDVTTEDLLGQIFSQFCIGK